ncbi:hypothetical protein GE118_03365 [Mycoplasma sp. NEAQ87857]|uniref:MAG1430 family protein n=1 Tax=Mycoplasma sp. NEAQ87857 TaxID=2683967 RepID=UPI001317584F|nr:hypothetical protein [Mycoplasma sp. NEAQ87857]QGZ97828.1 hypothetical protein GE118_03365 [Mycoplasma sp. NEAQ87857]
MNKKWLKPFLLVSTSVALIAPIAAVGVLIKNNIDHRNKIADIKKQFEQFELHSTNSFNEKKSKYLPSQFQGVLVSDVQLIGEVKYNQLILKRDFDWKQQVFIQNAVLDQAQLEQRQFYVQSKNGKLYNSLASFYDKGLEQLRNNTSVNVYANDLKGELIVSLRLLLPDNKTTINKEFIIEGFKKLNNSNDQVSLKDLENTIYDALVNYDKVMVKNTGFSKYTSGDKLIEEYNDPKNNNDNWKQEFNKSILSITPDINVMKVENWNFPIEFNYDNATKVLTLNFTVPYVIEVRSALKNDLTKVVLVKTNHSYIKTYTFK